MRFPIISQISLSTDLNKSSFYISNLTENHILNSDLQKLLNIPFPKEFNDISIFLLFSFNSISCFCWWCWWLVYRVLLGNWVTLEL